MIGSTVSVATLAVFGLVSEENGIIYGHTYLQFVLETNHCNSRQGSRKLNGSTTTLPAFTTEGIDGLRDLGESTGPHQKPGCSMLHCYGTAVVRNYQDSRMMRSMSGILINAFLLLPYVVLCQTHFPLPSLYLVGACWYLSSSPCYPMV